jgi:hypothetical protein
MTSEYFREYHRNEIFHKLRIDWLVTTALGDPYEQRSPSRVWVNTDDAPVTTALDLTQESQWSAMKSYGNLWAFIGTDPPENFFDWDLHFRLERVPRMLDVSGQHMDELPRHLDEWQSDEKSEKEAVKIGQAARRVFELMRTPEGIVALTRRLEASDPRMPRILGMTVTGQQKLGIRIT